MPPASLADRAARLAARLGLAVALGLCAAGAQAERWPHVELPPGVRRFDVGGELVLNGMPMRLQGFVSTQQPAQLAQWFRRHLGEPLVQNTVGDKLVLGRAQGEHYLVVQLERAGSGTRAVAAVSDLRAAHAQHEQARAEAERWLARLPAGSRVVSQMDSRDGATVSRHLVVVNRHDEALNQQRLERLMAEDGFELERQGGPRDEGADPALPEALARSRTLFFKAPARQAMATIARGADGLVSVVLNVTTRMQRY